MKFELILLFIMISIEGALLWTMLIIKRAIIDLLNEFKSMSKVMSGLELKPKETYIKRSLWNRMKDFF